MGVYNNMQEASRFFEPVPPANDQDEQEPPESEGDNEHSDTSPATSTLIVAWPKEETNEDHPVTNTASYEVDFPSVLTTDDGRVYVLDKSTHHIAFVLDGSHHYLYDYMVDPDGRHSQDVQKDKWNRMERMASQSRRVWVRRSEKAVGRNDGHGESEGATDLSERSTDQKEKAEILTDQKEERSVDQEEEEEEVYGEIHLNEAIEFLYGPASG